VVYQRFFFFFSQARPAQDRGKAERSRSHPRQATSPGRAGAAGETMLWALTGPVRGQERKKGRQDLTRFFVLKDRAARGRGPPLILHPPQFWAGLTMARPLLDGIVAQLRSTAAGTGRTNPRPYSDRALKLGHDSPVAALLCRKRTGATRRRPCGRELGRSWAVRSFSE